MLMCDKTLTLVQRTPGADDDTYTTTQLVNCSWYSKSKIAILDKGVAAARITRVRIPNLQEGVTLNKGDYLVNGVIDQVTKPSDLAGLEYITILSIGNNVRGRFPHWAVTGE